jgi:hypothetical protein
MNRDLIIIGAIGLGVYVISRSGVFGAVSNIAAFGARNPGAFRAAGEIVGGTATVVTELGNIWEGVQSLFGGGYRNGPSSTGTGFSGLFQPVKVAMTNADIFGAA